MSEMGGEGKKAEQSEATRRKLIRVSRRLFAKKGYAGTSIADITRAAKVTRGALYHHFATKEALFFAVYEDLERELTDRIMSAIGDMPPERHLTLGCKAFLDACLDPAVQRVVLIDATSVLDLESREAMAQQYGLRMVRVGVERAIDAGHLEKQPVDLLARILLGGLIEAGLVITRADDPKAARRQVDKAMARLIEGLKPPGKRKTPH